MASLGTNKPIPKSIAVFGASGPIGGPLARQVRYRAPDVKLRLLSSSAERCREVAAQFPGAECLIADLFDLASVEEAVAGVEGVFIVTPTPFDEEKGMKNLVAALRKVARPTHVVRIVGYEAESLARRVPQGLRGPQGIGEQHYVAKAILEESDLPVTYLNIGASFMHNLLLLAPRIKSTATLVWPERLISFIDARDVGEIAANLLLSPDERHIYQFLTLNNGHDLIESSEVAALLSDVLKTSIQHVSDRQAFVDAYGPLMAQRDGAENAAEKILEFFDYERSHSTFLCLNDRAARLLGRQPTTVRAWLLEHRHHFS